MSWFGSNINALFLKVANNLSDLANAAIARTNLGLGNVDNTSDANKPISTATQTALDLKAPIASPTFTGTATTPSLKVTSTSYPQVRIEYDGTTYATLGVTVNNYFVIANASVGIGTTTPNSKLQVAGPIATAYVAKNGNYTLTSSDSIVNVTGTNNQTLPSAANITGRQYTIKNTGVGVVTVNTTSAQTIDGAATYSLGATNKYVVVVSDGANWIVVGNN